jgi:hypothetical protein
MVDGGPVPETSASEAKSTQPGSPVPAKAGETLAGESEAVPRPAEASPAKGGVLIAPLIKLKPWRVIASTIGIVGLVLSVILVIASTGTREGTAALVALFFLSVAAIVVAMKPYWERWKRAQQIGGAAGAATAATLVLLALLQVLPSNSPPMASTPPTATASTPPSTSSSLFVVRNIEKTGYIDLDGMKGYDGGEDAPKDDVDIVVNTKGWVPRNAAAISPSKSGGKDICEQAIATDTPDDLNMKSVEVDKGFCAYSRGGHYAYVELLRRTHEDYDHIVVQVKLSVYP